ncbi:hypothetical protein LIER_42221 [Lithospermum erythrorhizon]|uniref:DUF4283 domain-containing protein n=1 Tax=Lithospermum erythrorhizon TaxID=34254 RepID=A0AAV3RL35_LITER
MSIANAVGTPLRVDPNNLNRTKLNSAHVCHFGWDLIKVFYDVIPPFCTSCYHIGHAMGACKWNKLEVTRSIGAETDRMAGADKVFDKMPHPEKTTAPLVQAATSSIQADQVAAGGDMNSKAINQTNKPAALVMQNSCHSCSIALKQGSSDAFLGLIVDDLLEQIGAVQVEDSKQIAAALDQPITKPTKDGQIAAVIVDDQHTKDGQIVGPSTA